MLGFERIDQNTAQFDPSQQLVTLRDTEKIARLYDTGPSCEQAQAARGEFGYKTVVVMMVVIVDCEKRNLRTGIN